MIFFKLVQKKITSSYLIEFENIRKTSKFVFPNLFSLHDNKKTNNMYLTNTKGVDTRLKLASHQKEH
jgi:hypothetical protein